jgi:hypothetical protein
VECSSFETIWLVIALVTVLGLGLVTAWGHATEIALLFAAVLPDQPGSAPWRSQRHSPFFEALSDEAA